MNRSHLACALVLVASLFQVACPGRVDFAGFRFIDRENPEFFEIDDLVTTESTRSWSFGAEERETWTITPAPQPPESSSSDLVFSGVKFHRAILERGVKLDAGALDALVVSTVGAARGQITLEWQRDGESFSPERQVKVSVVPIESGGRAVTRLPLSEHAEWNGEVTGLRLTVGGYPRLRISAVRAVRESFQDERLAQALGQPWKIDIGHEVRNALVSLPGIPTQRKLEIPQDAVLRFGYALQPGAIQASEFRVLAQRDGEAAATNLFTERLEADQANAWHEAVIDLADYAGESIELTLLTDDGGTRLDPRHGVPVWSNPEVLQRGRPQAPAVVLVSIDTLRADRLSLYGYERATTPHLDAWAEAHATVFENAVAAAPWTLPAHVSMLSGIDAHRHGVNYTSPAPATMTMLAERLREAGYTTVAITGGGFVNPRWGFAQGFDRYIYYGARSGFEEELQGNLDTALELLAAPSERPVFLFFHTYAVHNPYRARQPYFDQFSDLEDDDYQIRVGASPPLAEEGWRQRRKLTLMRQGEVIQEGHLPTELDGLLDDFYDSNIAYADQQMARLLEALEAPNLADRTVTVLTSDHGELLGEHDLVSHIFLYDENLMVPLIVAAPSGRSAQQRVSHQVRSVDIVPTILELTGLTEAEGIDGTSLVPLMNGEAISETPIAVSYAAAANRGISLRVGNRLKYIYDHSAWPAEQNREELFDLTTDASENVNLSPSSSQLSALREQTATMFESQTPGLRLRFTNASDKALQGAVRGRIVSYFTLKRPTVGCDCLELESEGRARFNIPPGEQFTIWAEDVAGGSLTIAFDGGETLNVDLETLDDTRQLEFSEGTGVSVWWQGRRLADEAPSESDEELREQLKALGYLN